jgi:protein-disulfide isomerase
MKRTLPFIIIIAVLVVALGAGWYLTRPTNTTTTTGNQTPAAPSSSSPAPSSASSSSSVPTRPATLTGVPGAEPAHTLGAPNARVQLEEFGDFQCPPCAMFHPILKQMHQEFGDQILITFRNYPLVPPHNNAVPAASAAEAAGLQGKAKFWEMHALIYEHQNDWKNLPDTRPLFESYAKQIGLDVERFKRDMVSEQVAQRIFLDGKRGRSLGVRGTPTLFLNGREVPFETLIAAEKLRGVIQNELNTAAAPK